FPGAARTYTKDKTFIDNFHSNIYARERKAVPYYPFASVKEWELVSFLERSKMSMAEIDEFLKLRMSKKLNLSFQTAKELRSLIEGLPEGPQWK
ncbi:hypothetical protein K438DRAFT_1435357, partial [Mycena galopus ATCC 62051]